MPSFTLEKKHDKLNQLLKTRGFKRRGIAYFRVLRDGVLQVMKYGASGDEFSLGLFSMYDDLEESCFTPTISNLKYNPMNYVGFASSDISVIYDQSIAHRYFSFDEQLYILENYVLDRLDSIITQKGLVDEIIYLDRLRKNCCQSVTFEDLRLYLLGRINRDEQFFGFLRYGLDRCDEILDMSCEIEWNDDVKFTPYLKSGQLDDARKVLEALSKEHHSIEKKMALMKEGNEEALERFLEENYQRNLEYGKFLYSDRIEEIDHYEGMAYAAQKVRFSDNEFVIYSNGKRHFVRFVQESLKKPYHLYLDDQEIKIPFTSKIPFYGFEHPLFIDGKKYICVVDQRPFDVIVDGKSVSSKQPFRSMRPYVRGNILMLVFFVLIVLAFVFDWAIKWKVIFIIGLIYNSAAVTSWEQLERRHTPRGRSDGWGL